MVELPDFVLFGARRNLSTLLRGMDAVTAAAVASSVKLSTTKLSNLRNNKDDEGRTSFDVFCSILAAAGLKIVPSSYTAIDPEELASYRKLAAMKCAEQVQESQMGDLT